MVVRLFRRCDCLSGHTYYADFDSDFLGVDQQQGRFADVEIQRCRRCGRLWLHYHFEDEAFTGSGRWYRGVVSPKVAAAVTADNAASILEGLDWYLAGGSYFDGTVHRRRGKIW
jgi:hypothetical protein